MCTVSALSDIVDTVKRIKLWPSVIVDREREPEETHEQVSRARKGSRCTEETRWTNGRSVGCREGSEQTKARKRGHERGNEGGNEKFQIGKLDRAMDQADQKLDRAMDGAVRNWTGRSTR